MTTWILLRGLAREARHWGRFGGKLEARLGAGHIVRALDLPGMGAANGLPSPMSVAGIAAECRARLLAQGAKPPWVLVGLSLGGMVAIEWSRRWPGEVTACAIVNSSDHSSAPAERLSLRSMWRIAMMFLPGMPVRQRERQVLAMTSNGSPHDGLVTVWTQFARSRPVTRLNVMRQLWAAARYLAPPGLSVPGLVIASANDRLVAPVCSGRLAQRFGWTLRVNPSAGHDLPLDDPAWLAEVLAEWSQDCHAIAINASSQLQTLRVIPTKERT